MKRLKGKRVVLGLAFLLLAGCTSEQVKGSVGKSIENTCRYNSKHCTVHDENER